MLARRWKSVWLVATLAASLGCQSGRHSAAGFRLPATGDIERGKAAFVAFGCSNCHEVYGSDLPRPTVQPPVSAVLGGVQDFEMTDGYLVTSIINPSYRPVRYPEDRIANGKESRMPHYADHMTVAQLTDIVAFLQSHYGVRRWPTRTYF